MTVTFTSAQLISQGVMFEVPDVPDTNVYQLLVSLAVLRGATTSFPEGSMLDVLNIFQTTPFDPSIPTDISASLVPGPVIVAPIGSRLDRTLRSFPGLVKRAASYKSGGSYVPIESTPIALPASTGVVVSGAGEYLGFSVRETSGANGASIVLHDSLDASGPILEEITLSAGESTSDNYNRPGRLVLTGIYAVITGAVEGSVFK